VTKRQIQIQNKRPEFVTDSNRKMREGSVIRTNKVSTTQGLDHEKINELPIRMITMMRIQRRTSLISAGRLSETNRIARSSPWPVS